MANKYYLSNKNGVRIGFSELGGRIFSFIIPTSPKPTDIIVGAAHPDDYITQDNYMGAICGRYSNRIDKSKFKIGNKEYQLTQNVGENHLHGGENSFSNVTWKVYSIEIPGFASSYNIEYLSKDGEEGYPGNLKCYVTYALTETNEFHIYIKAITDKATYVNISSHPYFNLKGKDSILDHKLRVFSEHYTPSNNEDILTGEIKKIKNSQLEFTGKADLGEHINDLGIVGLDHNYIIEKENNTNNITASLSHEETNRKLEIYSTQRCLQVYTGIHFNQEMLGKNNKPLKPNFGIALEPQNFPNGPNIPSFNVSPLLPGEEYKHKIFYKISF